MQTAAAGVFPAATGRRGRYLREVRLATPLAAILVPLLVACSDDYRAAGGDPDGGNGPATGCVGGCPAASYCGADGVCRVRAEDGAACSDDGACASGHCVGAAGTATCCATACLGEQRCLKAFKDEDRDGFGSRVGVAAYRCEGEIGKDPSGTARPFAANSDDCDDSDFRAFPGQTAFFDAPAKGGGFDFNCDGAQTTQYRVNSSKNLRCGICRCDTGAEVMACLTAPPAFPVGGAIVEGGACKCETADAARTFVTPPLTGLCGVAPQSATLCQSRISYAMGTCPSVVSTGPQGNIACQ